MLHNPQKFKIRAVPSSRFIDSAYAESHKCLTVHNSWSAKAFSFTQRYALQIWFNAFAFCASPFATTLDQLSTCLWNLRDKNPLWYPCAKLSFPRKPLRRGQHQLGMITNGPNSRLVDGTIDMLKEGILFKNYKKTIKCNASKKVRGKSRLSLLTLLEEVCPERRAPFVPYWCIQMVSTCQKG